MPHGRGIRDSRSWSAWPDTAAGLQAATVNGAEPRFDDIGTLETGKRADIVAVPENRSKTFARWNTQFVAKTDAPSDDKP
jgi:cytosine/adenosine deaminase-related metal-dependent hydrolase